MKVKVVDLSRYFKLMLINCFFMNFWQFKCSCGTNWNCTTIYILLTLVQLSNRQNQPTTLLHSFVMSSCDYIQENQWCPDFFMILHFKFTDLTENNYFYVPFQNEFQILVLWNCSDNSFFPIFTSWHWYIFG